MVAFDGEALATEGPAADGVLPDRVLYGLDPLPWPRPRTKDMLGLAHPKTLDRGRIQTTDLLFVCARNIPLDLLKDRPTLTRYNISPHRVIGAMTDLARMVYACTHAVELTTAEGARLLAEKDDAGSRAAFEYAAALLSIARFRWKQNDLAGWPLAVYDRG